MIFFSLTTQQLFSQIPEMYNDDINPKCGLTLKFIIIAAVAFAAGYSLKHLLSSR